ncbi:MAG: mannose-6-phosphate isomerase, class I [Acidimicrobiaceae bacterium]|nr:mannose-6-phosphate isomerase, class I [Acidimicrobiaceae bacterium]
MDRLEGRLQHYDWGSRDALAHLRGASPSGLPEAELWFGAHPTAPATIDRGDGMCLDEVVAAAPDEQLGGAATLRNGTLPFLVKLLAADRPLSLQVHPDREQAAAGHAAEEAAGVAVDAPHRTFVDPHPKPELVVAVSSFRALCGFRQVEEALEVAAAFGLPDEAFSPLGPQGGGAWPEVVERLLASTDEDTARLLGTCEDLLGGPWDATATLVQEVATRSPDDPALMLVPLLVEHHLQEGEALFLGAGVLHAYLGGVAVEVMASSDNVLRAGLTNKHVDIDGVVGAIDPGAPTVAVQQPSSAAHRYDAPAEEFAVWRLAGAGLDVEERRGPEVVVGVHGATRLEGVDALCVGPGEAVWVPHVDGPYRIDAEGIAYRVTVGDGDVPSGRGFPPAPRPTTTNVVDEPR